MLVGKQGGITCGAIDELRKSSKTIDERVIINFPDKLRVFATKQRMFEVFAIDEALRYRGSRFPGSRTLCHPDQYCPVLLTACRRLHALGRSLAAFHT